MRDQSTEPPGGITWNGAVPVSRRFNDPYYSLQDGLAETRHTFLSGNNLPARFAPGFQIAELGFGTGLNLLAALQAWRDAGQRGTLRFTTFEAYPLAAQDMIAAQRAFLELAPLAEELAPHWRPGARLIQLRDLTLEIVAGDARETLHRWSGRADAWFLDGFSPAKNPELWDAALLQAVHDHTKPGGTAASYTAAGHVRRALEAAGFDVTRQSGYGRKRHMTTAKRPAP